MNSKGANPIFPVMLVGMLLLSLAAPLWASEIIIPEVVAADMYVSGDIEAGREAFREIVRGHMERVRSVTRVWQDSPAEFLERQADMMSFPARSLQMWTSNEGWVRLRLGEEIPSEVVDDIVAAATELLTYAEAVTASREIVLTPEDKKTRDLIQREMSTLGICLTRVVAFLRGSGREQVRADFLARTGKLTEMPQSLEAFDTQNPSLEKVLRVRPPRKPTRTPPPPKWTYIHDDHPIWALVRKRYEAIHSGDLDTLRSLYVDEQAADHILSSHALAQKGYQLDSIGEIRMRPTGGGEYEIAVDHLFFLDANGERVRSMDIFLVREVGDGEYKVSYGSSEDRREAQRRGEIPRDW